MTGDLDALCDQVLKLCDAQGSILLANLPKSYQTAYKAKINPRDYGHEKLAHVLQALAGLHVETGPRGFVAREGDDVQPPPQTSVPQPSQEATAFVDLLMKASDKDGEKDKKEAKIAGRDTGGAAGRVAAPLPARRGASPWALVAETSAAAAAAPCRP